MKIYIASKVHHAPRWLEARKRGSPIISTWIDEADVGQTKSFTELWERIQREVSNATRLVLYHEPGEVLKGALIEVGMAIQVGIPIIVHTTSASEVGTWICHPLVIRSVASVEESLGL